MQENKLSNKMIKATKWSTITEIIAKLITPITNMILARVLAPDAFGVITTITMIVSFADMFTDAGFQKYLVQHEFNSENEKKSYTDVAFWTNLIISLLMWIIIIIFSDKLAIMVGNPGLGKVISVACMQLPLTSFSSIQMAIYRRDLDFKTLFMVRIIGISIPFIVTIPLAFLGYNYWSLILGNIAGTLINAVILTLKSKWRPSLFYKISILKEMLSFSIWSLIEAIAIWLTTWVDSFIIGSVLNSYYLGIYKTSLSTVNTIFNLITASTTPILFSVLSRVQNKESEFNRIFFLVQKSVAYIVMPMSVGIFIYRDLVVKILLGSKWAEASYIVGIWAIVSGLVIVLGHYSSEVYRSKGKPKLSFISQILHLGFIIPVCLIASRYNFWVLVNARALIRFQGVLVDLIIMQFVIGISVKTIFKNIKMPILGSIIMGIFGVVIRSLGSGILWDIIGIILCIVCYFIFLICFNESREYIKIILIKLNLSDTLKNICTKICISKVKR